MPVARWLKRPGWRGVLLGLGCATLAWLSSHAANLRDVEERLQDRGFDFRGPRRLRDRIVLVGLDEASLEGIKKPMLYASPELAEVVLFLRTQAVAAIGLDLLVPQNYTALPDLQEDQPGDVTKLGAAVEKAGNVVLAQWSVDGRLVRPVLQWQLKHLNSPAMTDFGFVNLTEDADVVARRQQLLLRDPGSDTPQPQFALALAAIARGWKIDWDEEGLSLGGDRVPLDAEQKLRINFAGPPGTFPVIPFYQILDAARGKQPLPGDVELRQAIVIIGTTARSQQDYHSTPYTGTTWGSQAATLMAGSEIHAHIAATLLDRAYIVTPPWPVHLALLLAVGALLGRLFARLNLGVGLGVAVLQHFGWKYVCLGLVAWLGLRMEMLPMLLLGALVYAATFVQRWWTLRRMVGAINAEAVVRMLEDDPGALDRRGEDRVITVLFAGIRDFVAISERLSAHELVALLNTYFSAVVPIVEQQGGTLRQYLDDGMLIIFGSPIVQNDQARRAVRAAVAMARRIAELRPQFAELDCPELAIAVGVSTGRAVTGMVGSPGRLDLSAIGETTRTALRLQARAPELNAEILLSRSTYLDLPREERLALGCEPEPQQLVAQGKALEAHAVRTGPPQQRTRPEAAEAVGEPLARAAADATSAPSTAPAAQPLTLTLPRGTGNGVADIPAEIGPYRIVAELGRGGMGVVYRAEDRRLLRSVALKVVRFDLAADPTVKARFLREARAAAAVDSDHIVPIFEADETSDGTPYLVMPYLVGETLKARLVRARQLPIVDVVRVGSEIAAGLAAAHARGLIHRDIKPANIWLERRPGAGDDNPGRVRLLDFGLARVAGVTELTHPGMILGTTPYMSPEQAAGQDLDARSDLFSLGTVLYQMLGGRLPFAGDHVAAVLRAIADHTPPPPSALRAAVPPELDRLVSELLAKRPDDRPASAREVQQRLLALPTCEG